MDNAGAENGAAEDGEEECHAGGRKGTEGTAARNLNHNQRRDKEDYGGFAGDDVDGRGFAGKEKTMRQNCIYAISQFNLRYAGKR